MRTRGVLATAAVAAVTLLAGCSSTVEGTASAVPTSAPPSDTAAPSTTAAPSGQVTPAPEVGPGTGAEARRLASVTSLAASTSPDRTDSCFPSGPFGTARSVDSLYFGDGRVEQELDRWGFVAGWGNCAQDAANNGTLTLVAEVSDPDSAVAAATALNEIALDFEAGDHQPVELPGLGVTAAQTTGGSDSAGGSVDTIQAWVPTGRLLAYAYLDAPAGGGPDLITRQLTDQLALLATFTPTPQAQVPDLPNDHLGLAAFALDPPGDLNRFTGTYDLEGYLRLAIDPVVERELLTTNGLSGFFAKQSTDEGLGLDFAVALYAFPSSAQSNAAYVGFAQLEATAFGGAPFVLPALPEAPCFAFDGGGGSFYQRCYVGYGSYLASVDVTGLDAIDDTAQMDDLLPRQRDLIDG